MLTWLVSKTVMQLLLQSVPIEMSGLVRCRKMWACLAASGIFVCGRSVIWIEEMMSPLGKVMVMGWFALVLLKHRVSAVMWFPVVPESAASKKEDPTVEKGKKIIWFKN